MTSGTGEPKGILAISIHIPRVGDDHALIHGVAYLF